MVSILINEDLLLRSFQSDDAIGLFRTIDENRQHLRPWHNWVDATVHPDHSFQFIQKSLQQITSQEALSLGIFYQNTIIGCISMHDWNHQVKKAQLGYWISKEFEGKGIITTGTKRFTNFLFEKLGLNKIELHFTVKNKRSAAVAERLGAKIEGIIRQSHLVNGILEDIVITGILKSEWRME